MSGRRPRQQTSAQSGPVVTGAIAVPVPALSIFGSSGLEARAIALVIALVSLSLVVWPSEIDAVLGSDDPDSIGWYLIPKLDRGPSRFASLVTAVFCFWIVLTGQPP